MKVVVLGSGVVGVTSAWYLAQAGHEVTVIDRAEGPALETSYANAGQVSPGYASPWGAPGIPFKAAKWQMLSNCRAEAYAVNKARMVRIAEYSRDCLMALRQLTGLHYDERTQGTLQLFRTQAQLDGIGKDLAVLRDYGVPYEVLDVAGCIAVEPGLATARDPFVGGLRLPHDETGDCFKFTNILAAKAQEAGVRFDYGVSITG